MLELFILYLSLKTLHEEFYFLDDIGCFAGFRWVYCQSITGRISDTGVNRSHFLTVDRKLTLINIGKVMFYSNCILVQRHSVVSCCNCNCISVVNFGTCHYTAFLTCVNTTCKTYIFHYKPVYV